MLGHWELGASTRKVCVFVLRRPRQGLTACSAGLPNPGIDYLLQSTTVGAAGAKPYIVSLSGLSLDDNLEMFGRASAVEVLSMSSRSRTHSLSSFP